MKDTPAKTPSELKGNVPVYHLYVVSTPRRDELQAVLKEQGVFTGIHYPIPLHLQKALQFLGYKEGDLPITEQAASQILSLPMFAELQSTEIEFVAQTIKAFYHK